MPRHKVLHSPRIARKKRKEKKVRILLYATALVVLVGAGLYALSLPELLIQDISFAGVSPIPEKDIARVVESQLKGRVAFVFPRASALFFSRTATEKILLESFPVLQSADVSVKNLASVIVSVVPRGAVARWCAFSDTLLESCIMVDQTGFAFNGDPFENGSTLPKISDRSATSSPIAGTYLVHESRLASLLSLFQGLHMLSLETDTMELYSEGEVKIVLANGGQIFLREDGEFESELDRLDTLLSEQNLISRGDNGLRVEYIDLRYGNKVYFIPRQ